MISILALIVFFGGLASVAWVVTNNADQHPTVLWGLVLITVFAFFTCIVFGTKADSEYKKACHVKGGVVIRSGQSLICIDKSVMK